MMRYDEATIDSALVAQKNELLARIGQCENASDLQKVIDQLDFLAMLWRALGYAYKTRELRQRVIDRARDLWMKADDFIQEEKRLKKYRKDGRVCRSVEVDMDKLREIMGRGINDA